jgi:hypothetical protein
MQFIIIANQIQNVILISTAARGRGGENQEIADVAEFRFPQAVFVVVDVGILNVIGILIHIHMYVQMYKKAI